LPSKSKAQQRYMGMVHGVQKGTVDPENVSPEVRKTAKTIKKKDAKDFAKTKHKGLPEKVKTEIKEDQFPKFSELKPKDRIEYHGKTQYMITKVTPKEIHIGMIDKGSNPVAGMFAKNTIITKSNYESQAKMKFIKKVIQEAWVSGADKKYDRENIPVGTTVKVNGKLGKVVDDAPTDGYAIVKVGGKRAYYHNSDLMIKENKKQINIRDIIKEEIKSILLEKRFPPKAVDFNKVNDQDGFWNLSIDDANKMAGLSWGRQKDIGGIILWLNMAASAWNNKKR